MSIDVLARARRVGRTEGSQLEAADGVEVGVSRSATV